MKRRSFFGIAAGAAVAGPRMAKQAVTEGLESLAVSGSSLGGAVGGSYAIPAGMPSTQNPISRVMQAQSAFQKLVGITAAQRAKYRKAVHVGQLDPDIAAYRSISLGAKIEWQKDRNVDRAIGERKSMLQRVLDGLPEYDEEMYL